MLSFKGGYERGCYHLRGVMKGGVIIEKGGLRGGLII